VDLPAAQVLSEREWALLLTIARCPLITAAARDPGHSCYQVVAAQPAAEGPRLVPEGWAGNLRGARVVFLSSNPALGKPPDGQPPETAEEYPLADWPSVRIAQHLGRRFDQTVDPPHVRDFRHRQVNGEYAAKKTAFWVSMHKRAMELLGPGAYPARNYVMTEVVHCKSTMGAGVARAAGICASQYLDAILALTQAPVVVVVGEKAQAALKAWAPDIPEWPYIYPRELGGRPRELVYIHHPAGPKGPKSIGGLHGPEQLARLQQAARSCRNDRAFRRRPP
jgi:hypothetical protein